MVTARLAPTPQRNRHPRLQQRAPRGITGPRIVVVAGVLTVLAIGPACGEAPHDVSERDATQAARNKVGALMEAQALEASYVYGVTDAMRCARTASNESASMFACDAITDLGLAAITISVNENGNVVFRGCEDSAKSQNPYESPCAQIGL